MKRIIAFTLALMLALPMLACANNNAKSTFAAATAQTSAVRGEPVTAKVENASLAAKVGKLVKASGEVFIVRNGKEAKAEEGQTLRSGTTVKTGANGSAKLDLGTGKYITLGKSSAVKLTKKGGKLTAEHISGGVLHDIAPGQKKNSYSVSAGGATMAVLGTLFITRIEQEPIFSDITGAEVMMFEGEVTATAGAVKASLIPGDILTIEGGSGVGATLTTPNLYSSGDLAGLESDLLAGATAALAEREDAPDDVGQGKSPAEQLQELSKRARDNFIKRRGNIVAGDGFLRSSLGMEFKLDGDDIILVPLEGIDKMIGFVMPVIVPTLHPEKVAHLDEKSAELSKSIEDAYDVTVKWDAAPFQPADALVMKQSTGADEWEVVARIPASVAPSYTFEGLYEDDKCAVVLLTFDPSSSENTYKSVIDDFFDDAEEHDDATFEIDDYIHTVADDDDCDDDEDSETGGGTSPAPPPSPGP